MNNPEWLKTAKVGDEVVCIAEPINPNIPENIKYPKKGEIVKIKLIAELSAGYEIGLVFYGYPPQMAGWDILYHDPFDFKPLQSRPTDISVFTGLLKSPNKKISEGA